MSDAAVKEIRVTAKAALWVSGFLTAKELRRKPMDDVAVRLAAGIANAPDPQEAAAAYWKHTEARDDDFRDELLTELRGHPSYEPDMEAEAASRPPPIHPRR